jgi:hypothetical protein
MLTFDPTGFARIGKMLFYRGGNQLAALVRYVECSEAGCGLRECKGFFAANVTKQLLALVKTGRLRREKRDGVFVYFSADESRCSEQQKARQHAEEDATTHLTVAEMLVREDKESLELLVKVLLTCLAHPQFNAKSVALSLARRGESICTAWVREMFERFDIVKKGS